MSLRSLFDEATVSKMMTTWPTEPALALLRDDSIIRHTVNAASSTASSQFWDGEAKSCCPPNPGI